MDADQQKILLPIWDLHAVSPVEGFPGALQRRLNQILTNLVGNLGCGDCNQESRHLHDLNRLAVTALSELILDSRLLDDSLGIGGPGLSIVVTSLQTSDSVTRHIPIASPSI